MTFRVGQRVTQIKPVKWPVRWFETAPEFGIIYTIRTIVPYNGDAYLRFHELKNELVAYSDGIYEMDFVAKYFRPVTDISVFHAILRTASAKEHT